MGFKGPQEEASMAFYRKGSSESFVLLKLELLPRSILLHQEADLSEAEGLQERDQHLLAWLALHGLKCSD